MEYTDEQIKNACIKSLKDFIQKIKNDEITIYNISGGPLGIKKIEKNGIIISGPSDEHRLEFLFYKNN